jgi:hypothetical protein
MQGKRQRDGKASSQADGKRKALREWRYLTARPRSCVMKPDFNEVSLVLGHFRQSAEQRQPPAPDTGPAPAGPAGSTDPILPVAITWRWWLR